MKPNSVLKLKRMAWVAVGEVAMILVLLFIATHSGAKPKPLPPPAPVVEVATVEQKDVPIYGEWIGTLTGQVNAGIKAQVTGYLLTQSYKEGSYVRKGQPLFEIDPRPFQAALDQAKGQLAQAEAQLGQEEARLATAEANQLKSHLDAIGAAKAQIQAYQAAVEAATINLNFTRIVSPIDGIAGIAQAQVGDLVSTTSGVLTTVSTLDPIRDYFTVSEQEYLALRKQFLGSRPEQWKLQLILADGTPYPHQGEFYFADRQVNQNTGAIQLAALFANPGNVLRPGQYGKVRAVIRVQRNALLIPQAAVNEQQGSYVVDVVGNDGKVAVRTVRVGDRTGTMWVIQDGLKAGERVIVEGQENLKPGTPVQTKAFKADVQAQ